MDQKSHIKERDEVMQKSPRERYWGQLSNEHLLGVTQLVKVSPIYTPG